MSADIRWKQRFENFRSAYDLLNEIIEENEDISKLEAIIQEGITKRFEFTLELAWKTLRDKMEFDGLKVAKASPKPVLKFAYQSGYIEDIDIWLEMVDDRNLLAHTYSFKALGEILQRLQAKYHASISALYDSFMAEYLDD